MLNSKVSIMVFLVKMLLDYKLYQNVAWCTNSLRYYSSWTVKSSHKLFKYPIYSNKTKPRGVILKGPKKLPKAEVATSNYGENLSAVLYGKNDIRLEEKPLPKCGEKEVLVATECVGLSQSDISLMGAGAYRDYTMRTPFVLGHEAAGTVVETGCSVKKLKAGDRVAIEPIIPCRICTMCKKGRFNLCPDLHYCGMPPLHGTLSRFFLWPEDYCLKIPHHVDFEEAALLEPLALAHHACKRGGVTVGSKVLISGAGPIGLLNMMCAKACGATNIVLTDIKVDRLRCANTMGANSTILVKKNPKDEALVKEIIDDLNGKPHVTLECSGSSQAIRIAADVTMPGGTIVLVGTSTPLTALPIECTTNEIDIRGVLNYCNNYQNAMDLIATGRLDLRCMITHDYKLNNIKDAYEIAKSGRAIKILIHTNPKWIPKRRQSY